MAKFCMKCGNTLNGEKFCPHCGAKQEAPAPSAASAQAPRPNIAEAPVPKVPVTPVRAPQPNVEETASKRKRAKREKGKKISKAKAVLISVAALIVLLAVLAGVLFFTSPALEVLKDFKSQEYSAAVTCYEREVEDNFLHKTILNLVMKNRGAKVLEQFADGELGYDTACEALEALTAMGFADTESLTTELEALNNSLIAFEDGNHYYSEGDYENAIKAYSQVTEADSHYQEAQDKLSEMYPAYLTAVTERADERIANAEYEQAVVEINLALSLLPTDMDVSALTERKTTALEQYKAAVLNQVTELTTAQRFTEALEAINDALAVDNNEDFQNAKATVEKQYVESVTTNVQNHLNNEDYISASRTVTAALELLPDNAELKALKTKVDDATPTYLLDVCKPYSSYWYDEYTNGETFVMGSVEYTNGFVLGTSRYSSGYAIFNIDGNYSTVSFSVGHTDESAMSNTDLKIYCDGILKDAYTINCEALPQRITVDVTGVKSLKIETCDADRSNVRYGFGNVIVK